MLVFLNIDDSTDFNENDEAVNGKEMFGMFFWLVVTQFFQKISDYEKNSILL